MQLRSMVVWAFSCILLCSTLSVSYAGDVLSDRAENTVIPYTLADRERMVRMETKLENVDKRLDSMDKRIDSLKAILLGGFGVLFSGMMALIGFVLWDRRSALAPAVRKTNELEEDVAALRRRVQEFDDWKSRLELVLKGSSKEDASKLAHILTTLL